jgi:hypothetical protein
MPLTWDELKDLSAEELRLTVELWMWGITTLNSVLERTAFDFAIVGAAQLEFEAVALLWAAQNEPLPWADFETKTTLKVAAKGLRALNLISDSAVIDRLEDIADFRNDVVHRRAAQYGVMSVRYSARSLDIFGDLLAFKQFVWDVERTRAVIREERNRHRPVPSG